MTIEPTDGKRWEELNALVDGELEPSRAADVAVWIADDRDAARAFAAVASLKAATAGIAPSRRGQARTAWRQSFGIAAAFLLAAGLGGVLMFALPKDEAPEIATLAPRSLGLSDDVTIGGIRLPNLESGGLRLERAGVLGDGSQAQLQASYVGERGCRVYLTVARIGPGDRLAAGVLPVQTTQWSVGPFIYTLTSERMDPQRFASVAWIAQADTAVGGPTRLAAGASDLRNRPCLG